MLHVERSEAQNMSHQKSKVQACALQQAQEGDRSDADQDSITAPLHPKSSNQHYYRVIYYLSLIFVSIPNNHGLGEVAEWSKARPC